jgi:hypothetical protein
MRLLALFCLLAACKGTSQVVTENKDKDDDRYFADEDCDDHNADAYPGATEVCDGADNDCDGTIDEGVSLAFYTDADGDGYGDPAAPVLTCSTVPEGTVENADDCDDTDATLSPLGTEACDGVDNDCDGRVDWGLRVPEDFALVSDAVVRAAPGEQVCVSAGTYTDNVDYAGRDVVVVGLEGPELTILDGGGAGPVVSFDTDEGAGATLDGFTVTNGDDYQGAGIYVRGASPTLTNLVVTGNNCTSTDHYCYGTGIYAENSEMNLSNSAVTSNVQASTYAYYPYNYGAGIYLNTSNATITDVQVSGNRVDAPFGGYYGGAFGVGMYVYAGSPTVSGLEISANTVDASDASYWYSYGVGMMSYYGGGTWSNVIVADNAANGTTVAGGGMLIESYSNPPTFTNLIVANNRAGDGTTTTAYGGGVDWYYTTGTVQNADFVGNAAVGDAAYGGNAFFSYYAAVEFSNTSFWGGSVTGTAASGGGGLAYDSYYAPGESGFRYCNISDNGDDPLYGVIDPTGLFGNISGDPAYTDTSGATGMSWDLRLGAGSDLIDAGDPNVTDADGSVSDIGAYGGPGGGVW